MDEHEEVPAENLQLQQRTKQTVRSNLENASTRLLVTSATYGLAIFGADDGLHVLRNAELKKGVEEESDAMDANIVPLEGTPSFLVLSGDETVVAVALKSTILFFDVASIIQQPARRPYAQFQCEGSILDICAAPDGVDDDMAGSVACFHAANVQQLLIISMQGQVLRIIDLDFQLASITWGCEFDSSLHDMLLCGDAEGYVYQVSLEDGTAVDQIEMPEIVEDRDNYAVSRVALLSSSQLLVAYWSPSSDPPSILTLFHGDFSGGLQARSNQSFSNLFYATVESEVQTIHFSFLPGWQLLLVGTSLAETIQVLKYDGDSNRWSVLLLDEQFNASCPIEEEEDGDIDTTVRGTGLLFSCSNAIRDEEADRTLPPPPVFALYTSYGSFLLYRVFDKDRSSKYPLIRDAHPLPSPRQTLQAVSTSAKSPITHPAPLQSPSSASSAASLAATLPSSSSSSSSPPPPSSTSGLSQPSAKPAPAAAFPALGFGSLSFGQSGPGLSSSSIPTFGSTAATGSAFGSGPSFASSALFGSGSTFGSSMGSISAASSSAPFGSGTSFGSVLGSSSSGSSSTTVKTSSAMPSTSGLFGSGSAFGSSSSSSPFGSGSGSAFGSSSSSSPFGSGSAFGSSSSSSPFGSSSAFGSSTSSSAFGSGSAFGSSTSSSPFGSSKSGSTSSSSSVAFGTTPFGSAPAVVGTKGSMALGGGGTTSSSSTSALSSASSLAVAKPAVSVTAAGNGSLIATDKKNENESACRCRCDCECCRGCMHKPRSASPLPHETEAPPAPKAKELSAPKEVQPVGSPVPSPTSAGSRSVASAAAAANANTDAMPPPPPRPAVPAAPVIQSVTKAQSPSAIASQFEDRIKEFVQSLEQVGKMRHQIESLVYDVQHKEDGWVDPLWESSGKRDGVLAQKRFNVVTRELSRIQSALKEQRKTHEAQATDYESIRNTHLESERRGRQLQDISKKMHNTEYKKMVETRPLDKQCATLQEQIRKKRLVIQKTVKEIEGHLEQLLRAQSESSAVPSLYTIQDTIANQLAFARQEEHRLNEMRELLARLMIKSGRRTSLYQRGGSKESVASAQRTSRSLFGNSMAQRASPASNRFGLNSADLSSDSSDEGESQSAPAGSQISEALSENGDGQTYAGSRGDLSQREKQRGKLAEMQTLMWSHLSQHPKPPLKPKLFVNRPTRDTLQRSISPRTPGPVSPPRSPRLQASPPPPLSSTNTSVSSPSPSRPTHKTVTSVATVASSPQSLVSKSVPSSFTLPDVPKELKTPPMSVPKAVSPPSLKPQPSGTSSSSSGGALFSPSTPVGNSFGFPSTSMTAGSLTSAALSSKAVSPATSGSTGASMFAFPSSSSSISSSGSMFSSSTASTAPFAFPTTTATKPAAVTNTSTVAAGSSGLGSFGGSMFGSASAPSKPFAFPASGSSSGGLGLGSGSSMFAASSSASTAGSSMNLSMSGGAKTGAMTSSPKITEVSANVTTGQVRLPDKTSEPDENVTQSDAETVSAGSNTKFERKMSQVPLPGPAEKQDLQVATDQLKTVSSDTVATGFSLLSSPPFPAVGASSSFSVSSPSQTPSAAASVSTLQTTPTKAETAFATSSLQTPLPKLGSTFSFTSKTSSASVSTPLSASAGTTQTKMAPFAASSSFGFSSSSSSSFSSSFASSSSSSSSSFASSSSPFAAASSSQAPFAFSSTLGSASASAPFNFSGSPAPAPSMSMSSAAQTSSASTFGSSFNFSSSSPSTFTTNSSPSSAGLGMLGSQQSSSMFGNFGNSLSLGNDKKPTAAVTTATPTSNPFGSISLGGGTAGPAISSPSSFPTFSGGSSAFAMPSMSMSSSSAAAPFSFALSSPSPPAGGSSASAFASTPPPTAMNVSTGFTGFASTGFTGFASSFSSMPSLSPAASAFGSTSSSFASTSFPKTVTGAGNTLQFGVTNMPTGFGGHAPQARGFPPPPADAGVSVPANKVFGAGVGSGGGFGALASQTSTAPAWGQAAPSAPTAPAAQQPGSQWTSFRG